MDSKDYQVKPQELEYDECISRGICSISPTVTSLQEVILIYLKELAFYLLELQTLGIHNEKIKENIIEVISGLVGNFEYEQSQFNEIILRLYSDLYQARDLYISLCEKNNLTANYLKSKLKISRNMTLVGAIRQGQKYSAQKIKLFSPEQKNLFEIILITIKSICIHIVELKGLGVEDDGDAYKAILTMLSIMNFENTSCEKLQEIIQKFVESDYILLQKLQEAKEEKYGEMAPTEVSMSTRPNKAILVSGSDVKELEMLLEATKGKDIDVYTHGHMIMAHAFPKFKTYPHLVGHIGKGAETYFIDFAAFPGVVFTTRHSLQRTENLYQSRIFTTDVIAPKGVVTIKNHNFQPLIEAALSAKGFTSKHEQEAIKINLHEKTILAKITEVAQRIENGEIKHFFAIGVSNHTKLQKEYFAKFLNLLGEDCFALSFSYSNGADNVLAVESDYKLPILYKALNILTRNISMADLNPIILLTRCDVHTIPNLLHLKFMGINKIYFTNCSPILVNPALVQAIRDMYDIKNYTNPVTDFKAMTNGSS